MSEQWLRPEPAIPEHAGRGPSAGEAVRTAGLERPARSCVPRGRSEGQPYGLILAALGGIGLIILAFV